MAEFGRNEIQLVNPNQPVTLNTIIGCNKGYIFHRNGSGIITLRGIVNNPYGCFARYQCIFNGNIAVPEGGTAGAIAVAIALDGEPILTSRAIYTPTVVDSYGNVTSTAIITVPKGCCFNLSVENVSESADPATTPAPAINVQNSNLTVARIA